MNEAAPEPPAIRVLVLADASSIHTEMWVRGLAATGPIELRLISMNAAGVRAGLRDIPAVRRIDVFSTGRLKESGGNWRHLLNVPKVMRAVRRMKPDAIVAIYLSSYGLIGAIAKGDAVLAHVLIGSDVMVAPQGSWIYEKPTRLALARGDLFVSASKTITARVSALVTIPAEAILTQQYGVDDWVIDYPIVERTYDFVSNRAWVPNSRIPELLRIFRRLLTPGRLALIGGGTPLEPEIRGLAAIDPRVVPLGVLSHGQSVNVVAGSSFYFSMTQSDGASLSLIEAMAVGAIPVISDIEPNREWVMDGVNGVLVPLGDEIAAAARIDSLLTHPEGDLDDMRQRNRDLIRERGSRTRNMARFRNRLDVVLAQRRGVDS